VPTGMTPRSPGAVRASISGRRIEGSPIDGHTATTPRIGNGRCLNAARMAIAPPYENPVKQHASVIIRLALADGLVEST
jgi:hypothetical protein